MPRHKPNPLRPAINEFQNRLLASGNIYESAFSKICDAGFDRRSLAGMLWGVCYGLNDPQLSKLRLSELGGLSSKQMDRLQSDLLDLANRLERIYPGITNQGRSVANVRKAAGKMNCWNLTFMEYDKRHRECVRARTRMQAIDLLYKRLHEQEIQYTMLPSLLRGYSLHLGRNRRHQQKFNKRRTYTHLLLFNLMNTLNVKIHGLFLEELSILLSQGFLICGGSENQIPKFLTTEALAKLRQRMWKDNGPAWD